MLVQTETLVAIPALPALVTSEKYFEDLGISLLNGNFRQMFLGTSVPEAPAVEIQASPLGEEKYGGAALTHIRPPTLSQYCYFLSLNRGSEERFVTKLFDKKGRPYMASAIWGSDMTGDPFWEVVCPPLMTPERLHRGAMIVSCK